MTILLLSNKWDISIDYVVKILHERNQPFLRLNTEDLVERNCTVSLPNFSFIIENFEKKYNLTEDLSSVLLRRPGKPFEFHSENPKPSESTISFVTDQWHAFISGLQSIPNILWINEPMKNNFAEIKINQLTKAKKMNLKIPKTCITSSKNSVQEFWDNCNGKVIAKALYSPLIKEKSKEFFIFSNRITTIDEVSTSELSLAPTIFQEELVNKTDYRLTIIGDDYFCVKINSNSNNEVLDWRTIKDDITFEKTEIPHDVIEKCIKLVKELGLVFGAIDLAETNNEYYFLEINPNGEWGWLQKSANLPIAETLVDYLSGVKNAN